MKNAFADEVVKIMAAFTPGQLETLALMTFDMIKFFNNEPWVPVYNKLIAVMDIRYVDEYFEEFSLENAEFGAELEVR